jgi:hypothetical protein
LGQKSKFTIRFFQPEALIVSCVLFVLTGTLMFSENSLLFWLGVVSAIGAFMFLKIHCMHEYRPPR